MNTEAPAAAAADSAAEQPSVPDAATSIKSVIAQCCDVDWETRRKGCAALKELGEDAARHNDIRAHADALTKCIADRLEDRNHKVLMLCCCLLVQCLRGGWCGIADCCCPSVQVVQAVLEAACVVFDHCGAAFKAHMEATLFPRLMAHVQSLTAGTAAKANELVVILLGLYGDSDIVLWCVKTLVNAAEVRSPVRM